MLKINKVKISQYLWEKIVKYYEATYSGVIPKSYAMSDFAKHRLESAIVQIKRLKVIGVRQNNICLDAGCGIGTLVAAANLAGYNYYGYEIDPVARNIAKEMLRANNISPSRIQSTPDAFRLKGKFDFISSFETVEHVADLNDYLRKLRKVIKKEGRLFIETPNYNIPYEPHFYIFFPPGPDIWKWWCCQLAGRTNKKFFDELRFVTHKSVELALRKQGFEFENLGLPEWSRQLTSNEIYGRSIYIQFISKIIRTLKMGGFLKWLASRGLYTPLVYLSRPR
ncbi:MAG: class I SAM-dependent methyltransferase [Patescibacteria group bacterium]